MERIQCKACRHERDPVVVRDDGICENCHEVNCRHCGKPRGSKKAFCSVSCQIKGQCDGSDNPDGCWVWRGAVKPDGYGVVHIRSKSGKYVVRAPPRVMFSIEHGEVPRTTSVVQKCGTKNCCNPRHLKLVVQELQLVGSDIEEIAC